MLVVCDAESDSGKETAIHPGHLKSGLIVMNLTAALAPTQLIRNALERSAAVVMPIDIFLDQALELARMLTNKPVGRDVLAGAIPPRFLEED